MCKQEKDTHGLTDCIICGEETDVIIEIKLIDRSICGSCSSGIFLHLAKAYATNNTVFDISRQKVRKPVETHPEIAAEVLNYLYNGLLKKGRPEYKPDKLPQIYLKDISARVNDGATIEELKAVCYFKYKEWKGDWKMEKFIKATTLFLKSNFDKYLAEVEHKIPKHIRVNTTDQRSIMKQLNSYGVRGEINEETDRLAKELMATGYDKKAFLNLYLKDKI